MSEQLDPHQILYVKARARGLNNTEACKRAGIARATGSNWQHAPWFGPALDEEANRLLGDPTAMLDELVPKAWNVVRTRLLKGDLDAARDVLDRRYGKPRQRQEITGEAGAPVEFVIVQPKDATE